MKKIKKILILFVGINFVMTWLSYAQPKISKENIPSNIPSDLRGLIERLYSSDPVERGRVAYILGQWGSKAVPAILFFGRYVT